MFLPQKRKTETKQKDTRKLWEVLDMCITLTVVMVSQVFAYVQTIQLAHMKYVLFFAYQVHLNKAVEKKRIKELDPYLRNFLD